MSFRVLFIYPNLSMSSMIPHSIAILSAMLKNSGIEVEVFDTTFYGTQTGNANEDKVRVFNVLPYDFSERGIKLKTSDVYADLRKHIDRYQPNLLAISFVEDAFNFGMKLLKSVNDLDIPVVAGGVFCTYAPEKVLRSPDIDYLIRGEGEKALLELCVKLNNRQDPYNVNNICYRKSEGIIYNPVNLPIDFDEVPFPDYSVFDEQNLYRPMTGKVYRTVAIELHRGCPFSCRYCNSAANNAWYMEQVKKTFFRKRTLTKFAQELDYMVKTYAPEFIYFISDTFLMMSDKEFEEFCEIYSHYKLPFFMNTRAETVTAERVERLSEINCHRANVGIEHGNESFRKEIVGRNISDKVLIDAVRLVGESSISTVSNNIIGFPGETRELIFDTIKFNRQIEKYCDSVNCTVFAPYHGAALRQKAIDLGYLDPDIIVDTACSFGSLLNMPDLTKADIAGLLRTFSMYVRFPTSEWPKIKIAEKFDSDGNKMHAYLANEYKDRYVKKTSRS